jgi:hypothetical protein
MRRFLPLLALGLLAPPLRADEPKKSDPESVEVPYRLTIPKHILVRAKINGKGPFNFILDTGAPALFLATHVAKKIGIKEDEKGWGTFDRFEIEGGVVLKKATGRIETPFQLEGMNGMGLGGAEIHGIIGYNILAQFRIDVDISKDKMTWTRLDWKPKHPMGLGQKGGGQGGLEIFGSIMQMLGTFLGRKAEPDVVTRGYLGVEVMDDDGVTVIKSVVPNSPAAEAGLKAGDRVIKFRGRAIYGLDEFKKYSWRVGPGEKVEAIIKRGKDAADQTITIKAGEGF